MYEAALRSAVRHFRALPDRFQSARALTLAPAGWSTWQDLLDARRVQPEIGEQLGRLLAAWQGQTAGASEVARRSDDPDAFWRKRIGPYYREVMDHRPELAEDIAPFMDRMAATRRCFVHGDLAPRNILVGPGGVWVEDFGIAHFGDPAFDPAFLLHHLMLEAIRHPETNADLSACAQAFWGTWRAGLPADLDPEPRYVFGHVGCLLIAEGDGRGLQNLDGARERVGAFTHGMSLMSDPPSRLDEAWPRLHSAML